MLAFNMVMLIIISVVVSVAVNTWLAQEMMLYYIGTSFSFWKTFWLVVLLRHMFSKYTAEYEEKERDTNIKVARIVFYTLCNVAVYYAFIYFRG
jgi:hypothetical protein